MTKNKVVQKWFPIDKTTQKWILNKENIEPFIQHIERYRDIQPLLDQVEMGNPLLTKNDALKNLLVKALSGEFQNKRGNQPVFHSDIIYDLVWKISEDDNCVFDIKKGVFETLATKYLKSPENIKRIFYENRATIEKSAVNLWQIKRANLLPK